MLMKKRIMASIMASALFAVTAAMPIMAADQVIVENESREVDEITTEAGIGAQAIASDENK